MIRLLAVCLLTGLCVMPAAGQAPAPMLAAGSSLSGEPVLVFADEFEGSGLAPGWRRTLPLGLRFMGTEEQVYLDGSDGSDAAAVHGGILAITARRMTPPIEGRSVRSAILSSEGSFEFTFGYTEARMKMPKGAGLWPAFWLFPVAGDRPYGEIDIVEALGGDVGRGYGTVHWGPDGRSRSISQFLFRASPGFSEDFHVFGVEWTEKHVTFYVDGVEQGWITTPKELKRPMYLLLNLAVGGWAGRSDEAVPEYSPLLVDYVRVWSLADKKKAAPEEARP